VLVLAFAALPFFIWSELGLNVLLALDALRTFNVAQVAASVLQLLTVVVLVGALGFGVYGALAAVVLAQAVIAGACIAAIYRLSPAIRAEWAAASRLLKGSAKLHLNAIGAMLFTQTNVIMVNHFCRPEETGYYQFATQLIAVAQLLPISISMVAYTIVGRDGPDRAWGQQRRLLLHGVGLSLLAIAGGYVVAPFLVTLLAGREFMPAVPLFPDAAALVGMTMSLVMASQWIGRGLFLQAAALAFAIGLLTIAGNAWLLPRVGVVGAVCTVLGVCGVSIAGNGGMAYWVERRWRAVAWQN
jgi:O-antigen/teichoic acid export membrane protein